MTTLPFRQRALAPGLLTAPPAGIRLVSPDAVPPGAVVLGVVVAVPAEHAPPAAAATGAGTPPPAGDPAPIRPLTAVQLSGHPAGRSTGHDTAAAAAPAQDDGITRPQPGLVVERWGRRVLRDGVELVLTRREFELLEYLARHPDRVFTRSQLLSAVWDITDPRYAPDRTVDVHVSRLRRKLGPGHAAALQSLRGVGYRWSSRVQTPGGRP